MVYVITVPKPPHSDLRYWPGPGHSPAPQFLQTHGASKERSDDTKCKCELDIFVHNNKITTQSVSNLVADGRLGADLAQSDV